MENIQIQNICAFLYISIYIYNIYACTAKFSFLKIKIFRDQNK